MDHSVADGRVNRTIPRNRFASTVSLAAGENNLLIIPRANSDRRKKGRNTGVLSLQREHLDISSTGAPDDGLSGSRRRDGKSVDSAPLAPTLLADSRPIHAHAFCIKFRIYTRVSDRPLVPR